MRKLLATIALAGALSGCIHQSPVLLQSPTGAAGSTSEQVQAPNGLDDWAWYRTPATGGRNLTFAVRQPRGVPRQQTVLLVHSSSGLSRRDLSLADQYAARGFTTVVGCWFYAPHATGISGCYNAPTFTGQSWGAVNDLNALVKAVEGLLPQPLSLVGLSRGAGVVALRAAQGHPEPVVLLSGLLTRPLHPMWGAHPLDDFPTRFTATIDAPAYVWSANDDVITPPSLQSDWFFLAMLVYGKDVRYSKYDFGGHDFVLDPALGEHTVNVTSAWLEEVL